ncbi:MAG: zinc-ribbon domain containing protein [Clostridia bacterium]|nr:zinc-ribbon domain containing protein [Clostridia bacterium]
MYEDKTLVCKECGNEFVFTAGEQEFYASMNYTNEPKRCLTCRKARKNAGRPEPKLYDAVCANCGNDCQVRFQPHEDRPVYCDDCFRQMKNN